MERAPRQSKVRHQRYYHPDGSESRRGRADSTTRRPNFVDQTQHNFGVDREARMDCFLEQFHFWHLLNRQPISSKVWKCPQYFETSVRGSFRFQQEHDHEGACQGAQRVAHEWVCSHLPALRICHHTVDWKPRSHQANFDQTVLKNFANFLILDSARLHFLNRLGREHPEKLNSSTINQARGHQAFYRNLSCVTRGRRWKYEKNVPREDMLILLFIHWADQKRDEGQRLEDRVHHVSRKQLQELDRLRKFLQIDFTGHHIGPLEQFRLDWVNH